MKNLSNKRCDTVENLSKVSVTVTVTVTVSITVTVTV